MITNLKKFLFKVSEIMTILGFGIPAIWVLCNCVKITHSVFEFWTVIAVGSVCLIISWLTQMLGAYLEGVEYRYYMGNKIKKQRNALYTQDEECRIVVNRLEMDIDY